MDRKQLQRRIAVAAGREKADTVIKRGRVVDVYNARVIEGDVAIVDGVIAGVGNYEGETTIDAAGAYVSPGLIDGHLHIESVRVTPEEMGRVCVPHGTTTLIADPHEIANVAGNDGIRFMIRAAQRTAMDIRYMLPSCVPATDFETAGAKLLAKDMEELIDDPGVLGLGEFMDFPGVIRADDEVVDKLLLAQNRERIIDGHSPGVAGLDLNAYTAAGIRDDHECSTVEEMQDRVARGMYVLLRHGSSCHDLEVLLPGITKENARRLVLCTDDKQVNTIFEKGHLEEHLRILRAGGIDPITALQMATVNAAECFRLHDRGAIAPGRRADIVLFEDLENFRVQKVLIGGALVAEDGRYLLPTEREETEAMRGYMRVKDFSEEKLRLHLNGTKVNTIRVLPGGVLTARGEAEVVRDASGDVALSPEEDLAKIAVVERHRGTGNVAVALLADYGLRRGAIALSVAHDSHNIIVAGKNNADMALAVEKVIDMRGGIALVADGTIRHAVPLPVAGLMSEEASEELVPQLEKVDEIAFEELGVSRDIDPVTTLCFMALPVIPEVKLTDRGCFDVIAQQFIGVENGDGKR